MLFIIPKNERFKLNPEIVDVKYSPSLKFKVTNERVVVYLYILEILAICIASEVLKITLIFVTLL